MCLYGQAIIYVLFQYTHQSMRKAYSTAYRLLSRAYQHYNGINANQTAVYFQYIHHVKCTCTLYIFLNKRGLSLRQS